MSKKEKNHKQLCVLAVRGVADETDYCVQDGVRFQNLPARVHLRKTLKNWLTHQQGSNGVCWSVGKGQICCDETSQVLSWSVTNEHLQAGENAQLSQIIQCFLLLVRITFLLFKFSWKPAVLL